MLHGLSAILVVAQALTFTEAVERATHAPAVEVELDTAEARAGQASHVSRMTANPTLQVSPGARAMQAGGTGGELYVTLTQRLNLGGLGAKRKATLEREQQHDAARVSLVEHETRRAAALAWLATWSAAQEFHLSQQEAALADELARRLSPLVDAGEATRVELSAAHTWSAEARLQALQAEGKEFGHGLELAQVLGLHAAEPQAVSLELPELDLPDDTDAALAHGDAFREVTLRREERGMEEARLEEVRAARAANLALGVNGWREGTGDVAAVLNVEVELPVFERGERERATQAAAVMQARGRARLSEQKAEAQRALVLHELEHSRAVLVATERDLLASTERLAEAQRLRFEAREGTAQEWLMARRAVLRARIELVRARADHVLARFAASELLHDRTKRNPR